MNNTAKRCLVVTFSLIALTSCDREATGQVAAVVNGEEITIQEINAELGSVNVSEADQKERVQQAALQRIVERRLLAQAARDEGIDQTPQYLLRERQLGDALLVQMLTQKTERTQQVPSQQEVDEYIRSNPALFDSRQVFDIDRIQFALPQDTKKLEALKDDHSMGAVAARLDQLGIEFQRDNAQISSAQLGQERLKQIQALPDGEPFVIPENGAVLVGVITGSSDSPVSKAEARPVAIQAMRNERLAKTLQDRLEKVRVEAEIEYQDGFSPSTQ